MDNTRLLDISKFQAADAAIKDCYFHIDVADECEKQIEILESTKTTKLFKTSDWVILWISLVGAELLLIPPIVTFMILRTKRIREKMKKIEELTETALIERQKAAEKAVEHSAEITVLPADYQYPMASEYICKVLSNGRAASLNDALTMCDEQIHRWKMEAMNQQLLEEQQRQSKQLAGIARDTRATAINTGLNLAATLLK
ncbi:MAG: hypothetical protein E7297_11120 [Lachnospiraceae bacterium]|nr:hypothetical protein [Lachnospiraceae bacterium]